VTTGRPGRRAGEADTHCETRMTMSKMMSKMTLAGALVACACGGIAWGATWVTPGISLITPIPAGPTFPGEVGVHCESDSRFASVQVATVTDLVGDTFFPNAPDFQDVALGRMTRTVNGDFELFMELAGHVPANPILPPQGRTEIWWGWNFDLDTTTFPAGYPWGVERNTEFLFIVRWNGSEFVGTAIDRRPLLTGGAAVVTAVPFLINGTTIEAVLDYALIGDVPPTFQWAPFTIDWAGPVGSEGVSVVDVALTVFHP
jgi:hypothetical protein